MGLLTLSSIVATVSILPATLALLAHKRQHTLLTFALAHTAAAGFVVATAASPQFAAHTTWLLGKVSEERCSKTSLNKRVACCACSGSVQVRSVECRFHSTAVSAVRAEARWADQLVGPGPVLALPPGSADQAVHPAPHIVGAGLEQDSTRLVRVQLTPESGAAIGITAAAHNIL